MRFNFKKKVAHAFLSEDLERASVSETAISLIQKTMINSEKTNDATCKKSKRLNNKHQTYQMNARKSKTEPIILLSAVEEKKVAQSRHFKAQAHTHRMTLSAS